MFSVNLKLSNTKIIVGLLLFTLLVVTAVSLRLDSFSKKESDSVECSTEEDVREYLTSFDLELGECTLDEITVPSSFGDVYENYNRIQTAQGFDLSDYKGEILQRYTFSVKDNSAGQHIFAEVLLFDGKIVGADIYSTEADGFIAPLK